MGDPKLELISVPRVWLERSMEAMIKWGTHMEYDCPGDTPEPCGQYCDICNRHIDDNDHTLGHELHCPIEVMRLRLEQ